MYVTESGYFHLGNGETYDDVPQVTGNDIRDFRRYMRMTQKEFYPLLDMGTPGAIGQLEMFGDRPIEKHYALRWKFVKLREKNLQPLAIWEPEHIPVTFDKIAGYFKYQKCVKCGEGFFNVNAQRRNCMTCVPYDGVGAKK